MTVVRISLEGTVCAWSITATRLRAPGFELPDRGVDRVGRPAQTGIVETQPHQRAGVAVGPLVQQRGLAVPGGRDEQHQLRVWGREQLVHEPGAPYQPARKPGGGRLHEPRGVGGRSSAACADCVARRGLPGQEA